MLLTLVIYVLAVARLTRLINGDTILDPARLWLATRQKQHWSIAHGLQANLDQAELYDHHRDVARRWQTALYFVQCPWCVGMWLTMATAWLPIYYSDNPVVRYVGIALATSHLIGVFAFAADTEEVDYEDETVN
jgi:hypothetical protein